MRMARGLIYMTGLIVLQIVLDVMPRIHKLQITGIMRQIGEIVMMEHTVIGYALFAIVI
jgi:hypothetical protein